MPNLLLEIQTLIQFRNRVMEAYNNHPNDMSQAKADHAFAMEIHAIIGELYPHEGIDTGISYTVE